MVTLTALWLPILLSAVAVFIVSSIMHMVIPMHKGDYKKMGGEADVMSSMRQHGLGPGQYMFPCPSSMAEMGSPEMIEKLNRGPVGFLTIMPNGPMNMGKSLLQWFVLSLVISVGVAYVATLAAIAPGATFGAVFPIATITAILAYVAGAIPDSIWKGLPWSITGKFIVDGVLYGVSTGAVFAWLWPGA